MNNIQMKDATMRLTALTQKHVEDEEEELPAVRRDKPRSKRMLTRFLQRQST
jgi:hypothetical protein